MKLEPIIQSEVSQKEIQILYAAQCRKTEKIQTKDPLQSNFNM